MFLLCLNWFAMATLVLLPVFYIPWVALDSVSKNGFGERSWQQPISNWVLLKRRRSFLVGLSIPPTVLRSFDMPGRGSILSRWFHRKAIHSIPHQIHLLASKTPLSQCWSSRIPCKGIPRDWVSFSVNSDNGVHIFFGRYLDDDALDKLLTPILLDMGECALSILREAERFGENLLHDFCISTLEEYSISHLPKCHFLKVMSVPIFTYIPTTALFLSHLWNF